MALAGKILGGIGGGLGAAALGLGGMAASVTGATPLIAGAGVIGAGAKKGAGLFSGSGAADKEEETKEALGGLCYFYLFISHSFSSRFLLLSTGLTV